MFLKSIELRGFKSFADFTEITFESGITSVVGPNGSGKSNISDAIKWCLGEQSVKSLRGGKMEDVIFAGTQYRKPVSLAQVSLIIDNSDRALPIEYNTVTISRKLYRSGESEYLINNKICRLKDIHELFFDTGIGKEGYSLIGQGKIDAILSGKNEERRALIEEAVGITKYKFKKEEAYSKIKQVDDNLIRINDILIAYDETLSSLYIEQKKAKEFILLSNKLKDIEVVLLYNKLFNLNKELAVLNNSLSKFNTELEYNNNNKKTLELSKEDFENKLEISSNSERKNKEQYYAIKEEIQNLLNDINLKKQSINMLGDSNSVYEKQIKENNFKIENIESRENIITRTREQLQDELKQLLINLEEFDSANSENNDKITYLTSKIESLKLREMDIFEKNTSIKNSSSFINEKIADLEIDREKVRFEIKTFESNIEDIQESVSIENKSIQDIRNSIIHNQTLMDELEDKMKLSKEKSDDFRNRISLINNSIVSRRANLDILIEFENKNEGFNKTSKLLFDHIQDGELSAFKDRCFLVGNIFETQKKYELAIETSIGGHMSDIITDNDETAKFLIKYLKNNKMGRVTFYPLNTIKDIELRDFKNISYMDGFIDLAINLVVFDKKFLKAAKNILGRTLVCDNIDNALKIAKAINFSSRIITLDSQVINSGGSFTGGSNYFRNTNIIGRKRIIEEERHKLELEVSEFKKLESIFSQSINDIENMTVELRELDSEGQKLKIDLIEFTNRVNSKIELIEKYKFDKDLKISLINDIDDKINLNRQTFEKLSLDLLNNDRESQIISKNIEELNKEIGLSKELIKNEEEKNVFDRIRKAKLEENLSNICQEIQRITLEKNLLLDETKKIKDNLMNNLNEIEINSKSVIVNEERVEMLSKDNESIEKSFDRFVIEQVDFKNKIKELFTYIEDCREKNYQLESGIKSLEIKIAKFDIEFRNSKDKLLNDYNLEFDSNDFEKYLVSDSKIDSYNTKITELKNNISELGLVNVKSIDEYEVLKEKVDFMNEQKDDLDRTKLELEKLIEEITIKMREIFNINFKIINENFNRTFKDLFKGGSATLVLGEGDELESTIDIIVEPPGKKLQNINLLSGGEKGLSAISLLFAILRIKPAPFCILDEIEAALDDNNTLRFSEFLRQFSSNIQFIVITHRKITMEASDIIYGVTMQEKGVSKIVSINLANYKLA